jgi:DNA excision repair protein ERCC-2
MTDPSLTEVKLGVHEFLQAALGGQGEPGAPAVTRLREGTAGHAFVTAHRPEDYLREVALQGELEWKDFRLMVRGRADGLMVADSSVMVEEIKTTYLGLSEALAAEPEAYLAQLKLYMLFAGDKYPEIPVTGRLTYFSLATGEEGSRDYSFDREQLREYFRDLAIPYLESLAAVAAWTVVRNKSIEELEFPFAELRPGQEELINCVREALKGRQDALIEAPTGIGKTAATLYASLKELARIRRRTQVFYLTAKTAGRAIVEKTLSRFAGGGLRLRTVFIEAKERMCSVSGMPCRGGQCPAIEDYDQRIAPVLQQLLGQDTVTPGIIRQVAEPAGLCPFEVALSAAEIADLIVCDYNYVFDPGVVLKRFFVNSKQHYVLLVDEAHNLVDRGRDIYSASLFYGEVRKLRRLLNEYHHSLLETLDLMLEQMNRWVDLLTAEERSSALLTSIPEELDGWCERFLEQADDFRRRTRLSLPEFETLYWDVVHFGRVVPLISGDYAIWVRKSGRDLEWKLFCLNPGPMLSDRLKKCDSAVFFSATLSPLAYFRELLGLRDGAMDLQLPSPFPQENRLYLHVPGVSTRYQARQETRELLAAAVSEIAVVCPGNYLVFFPSYAYMRMVYEDVSSALMDDPEVRLFLQTPGMDVAAQRHWLTSFTRNDGDEVHLGFAVLGGLFGEGVDLPGERLIGAFVVGPGLPTVSEEQEVIRRYFDERNGQGFMYAYVIPGLIRVIQAAGRVFRTPEDKGVVVLFDDRFLQPQVQELLPVDWFDPRRVFSTEDYVTEVEEFWGES